MPRHLVSVRVTKPGGKFSKTHLAEINAPSPDEALTHLVNRCKPGREYARKFPGCSFSQMQVTPLYPIPVQPRERVVPYEPQPSELLYGTTDPYEVPLVMPGWARSVPALAKEIDAGYERRRAAGLPIDGTLPEDWRGSVPHERWPRGMQIETALSFECLCE